MIIKLNEEKVFKNFSDATELMLENRKIAKIQPTYCHLKFDTLKKF